MKKNILIVLLCIIPILSIVGQTDSIKKVPFSDYNDLRRKQIETGVDSLIYVDSTFNYMVKVPDWLTLRHASTMQVWGGTLPANADGKEDAIVIKGFDKDANSYEDFKKYIIEAWSVGQIPQWSASRTHAIMGKEESNLFKDMGYAYKVELYTNYEIRPCLYVLVETKTAYLWIDFMSHKETFEANIDKFKEFMSSFKKTDF